MEGGRPRSGDGTLLCLAQLPGAPEPLVTHDLIGINLIVDHGGRSYRKRPHMKICDKTTAPAQASAPGAHHGWVTSLCGHGARGQAHLVSLPSPTERHPL